MFIYLVSLLYSLINYSFFLVFLLLLLSKYSYRIIVFIFIYYLLTYFVFLNLQKNSKKEKSVTSAVYYSISHFGTD